MTTVVSSATDILLALLYAKGATGKYNESIAGTTKIEKFLFILEKESKLKNIINTEYNFQADNFGPCAHEIFDDLEMLKDAGIIKEEIRPSFSTLDEGDLECETDSFPETDSHEVVNEVKIFSLTEKGEKIGKIIFDSLTTEDKEKIILLKKIFNKKTANVIIKYVYEKYPDMITESKIREKILN